jgi:hypothetical protein
MLTTNQKTALLSLAGRRLERERKAGNISLAETFELESLVIAEFVETKFNEKEPEVPFIPDSPYREC